MKRLLLLILTLAGLARADREIAGVLFTPGSTNEPQIILPLKNTDVVTDVTAAIAQTRVSQTFQNDTDQPLEAIYIFPLPSDAAITDFEIRLKDRTIRSVVKEKAAAKATYEKAKAAGKKTALMEQERPNIFTTSVANLLPGETVDIVFTYVETLRFQKDSYSLTFPMVVGERYIPFKFDPQGNKQPAIDDAVRLNPPVLHPNIDPQHELSIRVDLNGLPIKTATSSTHAIQLDRQNETHTTVSLAKPETLPNSEFNIVVHLKENETPEASFVQSAGHNETYGLLSVFPPIGETRTYDPLPKDVIFLIDTSGSMSGESMAQARSGLKRCLNILNPDDRFTIIRFASDYSWFSPDLRPATHDKLEAATEYITGLDSGGGTEMQPALDFALDLPQNPERMPLIIFLTDGDVGNEDTLLTLLSQKLGNTRLFTFGIGSAPNEFLMHRMAEVGRGQSRFIRSHEDIGEVMADFFQTLENPVLTDISIEWDNTAIHSYPERCPDIFYGRPLQLVSHAPDGFSGQIKISGTLDGSDVEYIIDLDQQTIATHPAINQLYGRMELKDLMLQSIKTDDPVLKLALKQQTIDTALKYQLISKYTSRVAVEDRVVVENGTLKTVNVPVPSPKGWKLHATATQDTLWLTLGIGLLLSGLLLRKASHAA